jgi:hypothetical protein
MIILLKQYKSLKVVFLWKLGFFSFKVLICFGLSTLIFFFSNFKLFYVFFLNKKTLKKIKILILFYFYFEI